MWQTVLDTAYTYLLFFQNLQDFLCFVPDWSVMGDRYAEGQRLCVTYCHGDIWAGSSRGKLIMQIRSGIQMIIF